MSRPVSRRDNYFTKLDHDTPESGLGSRQIDTKRDRNSSYNKDRTGSHSTDHSNSHSKSRHRENPAGAVRSKFRRDKILRKGS